MENRIGQENQFSILPAPDENSRLVVKPNPDFVYSSAFYNLKDGPIRITGELPDSIYWSVALYEPNTTNFYIKNDREFQSNQLDLIITRERSPGFQSEQILSQTKKGFVLLRLLKMKKSPENELTTMAHLKTLNIEKIVK